MKKNVLLVCCLAIGTALSVRAETIIALTSGNHLVSFDHATPGTLTSMVQVTGLQPGERLLGIDFRPATGGLYALGSTSRLYELNAHVLDITLSRTSFRECSLPAEPQFAGKRNLLGHLNPIAGFHGV